MKYGGRCECGKVFTRGRKQTRRQYADVKVEHMQSCRKMWDLLKRSGKEVGLLFPRPAENGPRQHSVE